jgi:hypothetical protein
VGLPDSGLSPQEPWEGSEPSGIDYRRGSRGGTLFGCDYHAEEHVDEPEPIRFSAIPSVMVTTTVHDNYFMLIELNYRMPVSPTDRDAVAKAELERRRRRFQAVQPFREHVPGFENAFIVRTSPRLCIRRGRLITCDYDVSHEDVIDARHFDDDILPHGFHDSAPRLQIEDGGTYGTPYRAPLVKGVQNLYAAGMMITSDR